MVVQYEGKLGFGHEQRIMQGLAAALRREKLQLEARPTASGSAAPADVAMLFYRVPSRLDVRNVLQQAQELQGGSWMDLNDTPADLLLSMPCCQTPSRAHHGINVTTVVILLLPAGGKDGVHVVIVLAYNVPPSQTRKTR